MFGFQDIPHDPMFIGHMYYSIASLDGCGLTYMAYSPHSFVYYVLLISKEVKCEPFAPPPKAYLQAPTLNFSSISLFYLLFMHLLPIFLHYLPIFPLPIFLTTSPFQELPYTPFLATSQRGTIFPFHYHHLFQLIRRTQYPFFEMTLFLFAHNVGSKRGKCRHLKITFDQFF